MFVSLCACMFVRFCFVAVRVVSSIDLWGLCIGARVFSAAFLFPPPPPIPYSHFPLRAPCASLVFSCAREAALLPSLPLWWVPCAVCVQTLRACACVCLFLVVQSDVRRRPPPW